MRLEKMPDGHSVFSSPLNDIVKKSSNSIEIDKKFRH